MMSAPLYLTGAAPTPQAEEWLGGGGGGSAKLHNAGWASHCTPKGSVWVGTARRPGWWLTAD